MVFTGLNKDEFFPNYLHAFLSAWNIFLLVANLYCITKSLLFTEFDHTSACIFFSSYQHARKIYFFSWIWLFHSFFFTFIVLTLFTGIKPFVCAVCGTTFTRQHSLNYHMLIHNNESRFACPECDRTFRHPSHFKEHLRKHTGWF